jgi:3-oxoacyl-(acyl-carrier-protein) synthase
MTAKMSRRVDPYIAYLVVAAKKALHDAGIAEGSDKMCVAFARVASFAPLCASCALRCMLMLLVPA